MTVTFDSAVEKIEASEAFKNFKKKNEDAFLCAGFFVIDYEQGKNQQQVDYSLKNSDIYTFILGEEISYKKAETIEGQERKLPELKKDIKVDLDDIENIVKGQTDKKVQKIIAVLQGIDGVQIWNINCMLEGFTILHLDINSETGNIIKSEKRNLFDFVKRVK